MKKTFNFRCLNCGNKFKEKVEVSEKSQDRIEQLYPTCPKCGVQDKGTITPAKEMKYMEYVSLEYFTEQEQKVISILRSADKPLTAPEIAKKAKTTSYPTTFKMLEYFENSRGLIRSRILPYKRKWVVWFMPNEIKRRITFTQEQLKKAKS